MYWSRPGVVIALPVLGLVVMSLTSKCPDHIGTQQGRLSDCPKSPNCVSSQANGERHAVKPIHFEGSGDEVMGRLLKIVVSLRRTNIVTKSDS